MKLLLVEDSLRQAEDLKSFLETEGYLVEHATDVCSAKDKAMVYDYELIVLDLGLPDGNGLELLEEVKKNHKKSGILILTAKDAVDDKVKGLELGADDYVTKPYHNSELLARIKSIIRRKNFDGENIIRVNDISINLISSQISIAENVLELTKKEYDLLLFFVQNKNRVLTKESIAEHLWGDNIDQVNNFDFIYNHVKNVRKKIAKAGGKDSIRSIYGMGYKLFVE